jgi:hypothetical protein
MTVIHRSQMGFPNPQRAPFTPPAAMGFAARPASRRQEAADDIEEDDDVVGDDEVGDNQGDDIEERDVGADDHEADDIQPDEDVRAERRASHVPGRQRPLHHRNAAGTTRVAKAEATPAASIASPAPAPVMPAAAPAPVTCLSLLTSREAASILRVSLQRLESWRRKEIGPAFIKINARTIHYRAADIDAFLAARLQPGASA